MTVGVFSEQSISLVKLKVHLCACDQCLPRLMTNDLKKIS